MKNVPTRTIGEAMPSLTRRLFLRGAAVVAPLAAMPALAVAAPSYVEENPVLLTLEPELDRAEADMINANEMYREALKTGSALWPRAPESILSPHDLGWSNTERDIKGAGYGDRRRLCTADEFRYSLRASMRRRKVTMAIEEERSRLKSQLADAIQYEAACERAKKVSAFPQADELREGVAGYLFDIVAKIQAEPSHTMAGVRLKAKAFRAWGHAPYHRRIVNLGGSDQWMPNLARTLLETLDA